MDLSRLAEECGDQYRTYLYEPDSFRPLALIDGYGPDQAKVYYYHLDHLGTPQELTNAQGDLVWSVTYRAYGNVLKQQVAEIDNPLRFQGQYHDPETGLHYNRHRYYNPATGRFLTPDPIGLAGGLNNYQYVPNPTGWVDPLGLVSVAKDGPEVSSNRNDLPYNSRRIRDDLVNIYGVEKVTSTTVPPLNAKNVKLAGMRHPVTGIVFDDKGFPIFDDVAAFDTRLPVVSFRNAGYTDQMRMATNDLAAAIERGEINPSIFSGEQLRQIQSGSKTIIGFTWHHHQDTGRMQLVPRDIHGRTGHVGWEGMSDGK